jgi:hypothetical protein
MSAFYKCDYSTLVLVPSNMVIVDKPIPGYNDILRTADKNMVSFDFNPKVNYTGVEDTGGSKTYHQPEAQTP